MFTFLLALIYLAFISLGLPDSLLGAGWPVIHTEMNVPVSFMGIVSMIISGSTIVSSLLSDRMTRKFGTRIVTVTSVFLTAFALLGFSFADRFWLLMLIAVPYGLGAGAIDAALNNYVALHYTSRHMSWLHCFWGVGTIISPFVMSYSLTQLNNWHYGYRIVGVIQFFIALILLATISVWNIHKAPAPEEAKPVGLMQAFKIRGVAFLLLGFLSYCSVEATSMYWAATYLVEAKGVAAETAASFAALTYIGITAGRFASGFVSNRFGDHKMIRIGAAILSLGIILLMLPLQNTTAALAGFVIIGFGCAPVYPSIIHSTPANFGAENSGAIIGIQMASAYLGTTLMPPLFGVLGNYISFKLLPFFLALFVFLMLAMIERTFKMTENRN